MIKLKIMAKLREVNGWMSENLFTPKGAECLLCIDFHYDELSELLVGIIRCSKTRN
jgi:hypothetical protein